LFARKLDDCMLSIRRPGQCLGLFDQGFQGFSVLHSSHELGRLSHPVILCLLGAHCGPSSPISVSTSGDFFMPIISRMSASTQNVISAMILGPAASLATYFAGMNLSSSGALLNDSGKDLQKAMIRPIKVPAAM